MLSLSLPKDYLERYPNYILHPANFNLNPNKIVHFNMGLSVSPDRRICSMYGDGSGNHYKEWLEVAWKIKKNITFWIRVLTYIGKEKIFVPDQVSADKFYIQIVDHNCQPGKFNYGYGKEYINMMLNSIDDVFYFMKNHHLLSKFFFTEQEKINLKLNNYKV